MNSYTTTRLTIVPLEENHTEFIFELVNTPAWKEFIGERNIHSMDDALTYVQMIISDADIDYWVVTLNGTNQPVGIITFIKREYLDHPDIGFAFLPDHSGFGYAREATEEVLDDLHRDHPVILATTMPANIKSIKLLDKLGFSKIQEMVRDTESFLVFKKDAGF